PTARARLSLHDALPICGRRRLLARGDLRILGVGGHAAGQQRSQRENRPLQLSHGAASYTAAPPDRKPFCAGPPPPCPLRSRERRDRKSTRLNSSHVKIS